MKIDFKNEFDLNAINMIFGRTKSSISALAYDSKKVKKNTAFFCITGANTDGHQYIKHAIDQGASVIIGTKTSLLEKNASRFQETTFISVKDVKTFMADCAALFYKKSYTQLSTFAVTGTNGKTTVVSYIHSLPNHLNVSTGSIGTAGIWDDESKLDLEHSTHTTPEANDLLNALDVFHKDGLQAAAIEVTSIAIELQRIEGLLFDVGIHTNLTSEHLDFHSTFENYKQAKMKLFKQVRTAIVNVDDPGMAEDILNDFKGPTITYSLEKNADVCAKNIEIKRDGTHFDLHIYEYHAHIHVPVYGEFNISNLLAAISACLYLNIPPRLIAGAAENVKNARDRFEVYQGYADYTLILDFAHTPEGLGKVVETARQLDHNKLILLITGVGLRDPRQRPELAQAVEGKAEKIVVSVDHPGYFDKQEIADDVVEGFQKRTKNIHVHLDREEAIIKSLSLAEKGDIVLITGLGSVGYQVIKGENIPYSDKEVITRYFKNQSTRA